MCRQIRRRSQLEISSSDRSTTIRIVVDGSFDDIDDPSPTPETGPLAALSRKLSSRRSRQQQDCRTTTPAPSTTGVPEVNTGSNMFGGQAPSSNVDVRAAQSKVFSRRNVTGTCRSDYTLDRDDISICTFSNIHAISTAATGSRPIDNSDEALLATATPTPTSCRDDNGEVRVRFRFDSVNCTGADQKDVTSTCPLPKEPHPVRDQTVHRRSSPADDTSHADIKSGNSVRLSCPPTTARRLSAENVEEVRGEAGAPRRWQFRRRAPDRRRERPSSALRKEIKAARQLGVIMGAFTLCFLS